VSIKYKIIILISLLTFSTVLACGATYYVVSAREHDALLIDIAGAQRMLLQKMGKDAILKLINIELTPTRLKCALLPLEVMQKAVSDEYDR